MTHTSRFPLRSLSKTILLLSGDQDGNSSFAELFVKRVSPVPSPFIV
jgi:hypothetical protein